jgi:adenine-specific DNA-methyltransferase
MTQTAIWTREPEGETAIERRRRFGVYYTPRAIADWLAAEILNESHGAKALTVLDPACGNAELLVAVRRKAADRRVRLIGIDVDAAAVAESAERLGPTGELLVQDALSQVAWEFSGELPDAVIANPPWGAAHTALAAEYRRRGFSLATGQFDSYELFVELAIQSVKSGGVIGLVLPDSLLLPEHERTRRLLLQHTHLVALIRLGEGVFDQVFRGVLLVVARKGAGGSGATVRCGRVDFRDRHKLSRGESSLDELLMTHPVPQSRFATNPHAEFDLDVRSHETGFFRMAARRTFPWMRLVRWGRGIEIGKFGEVWVCPKCELARPKPRRAKASCMVCGTEVLVPDLQRITRSSPGDVDPDWAPLIVGSDVSRYAVRPGREIRVGVPGIRYKSDLHHRKIVVRKTGVAIQAAIDESGAQTVQSVFHCVALPHAPEFVLDYLLGVLNSRPVQAFYLRQSGEHEWRSHPYVTPRVLRSLPIPDPTDPRTSALARQIADAARRMTYCPSEAVDLEIEGLVGDLYELEPAETAWVHSVIGSAQQLRSISRLALPAHVAREAIRVSA